MVMISVPVRECGGLVHSVSFTDEGNVWMDHHPQHESERALVEMGAEKPTCFRYTELLIKCLDDHVKDSTHYTGVDKDYWFFFFLCDLMSKTPIMRISRMPLPGGRVIASEYLLPIVDQINITINVLMRIILENADLFSCDTKKVIRHIDNIRNTCISYFSVCDIQGVSELDLNANTRKSLRYDREEILGACPETPYSLVDIHFMEYIRNLTNVYPPFAWGLGAEISKLFRSHLTYSGMISIMRSIFSKRDKKEYGYAPELYNKNGAPYLDELLYIMSDELNKYTESVVDF